MCVSAIDTMDVLENRAEALQSVYKLQSAAVNNSLENDCVTTDKNGLCLAFGGRYTTTDAPTADSSGAFLATGYRINPNFRVGAFVDTGLSSSAPNGISLERHTPLWGIFGAWQAQSDGQGYQIKVAYARNQSDLKVQRPEIAGLLSEPGHGRTSLTSEAAAIVGSYGFTLSGGWQTSPYVGLRHTRVKADGYTEDEAGIVFPLTYASLELKSTTLLAGVRLAGKVAGSVDLNASLGLEHDLDNNDPSYRASGMAGLSPIAFNPDKSKTRPVASLGAAYNFGANQQLGIRVLYREEIFRHSESIAAYATYSIGF